MKGHSSTGEPKERFDSAVTHWTPLSPPGASPLSASVPFPWRRSSDFERSMR